jgi:hypothetical protein
MNDKEMVTLSQDELTALLKSAAVRVKGRDFEAAADLLDELRDMRLGWTGEGKLALSRAAQELRDEIGPPEECAAHESAEECEENPDECHA